MKQYDVVALGESLVDVLSRDGGGHLTMEGNPGGAPANVLAGCAKLGLRTAFIGKLGEDGFGRFLAAQMEAAGIDTRGVVFAPDHPTTLAMVTLSEAGDRDFAFYRTGTADVMLEADDVDGALVENCRVFHFGSLSLTDEPARTTTLEAVARARAAGAAISYDPNLREPLWSSLEEARRWMLEGMKLADYVKVSGEELALLSGEESLEAGLEGLAEAYSLKLLVATLGPGGCACRCGGHSYRGLTYDTDCVDTTGAGDAFWGATLTHLLRSPVPVAEFGEDQAQAMMDFANAAGALTATRYGGIPAMPGQEEILTCMRTVPRCQG